MKKNIIVGIALAMGILSVGAIKASAASSCCSDGKCGDKQVVQQFTQETATLTSTLKAKNIELRELYIGETIDTREVDKLETELKELKSNIKVIANKYGISSCCIS